MRNSQIASRDSEDNAAYIKDKSHSASRPQIESGWPHSHILGHLWHVESMHYHKCDQSGINIRIKAANQVPFHIVLNLSMVI